MVSFKVYFEEFNNWRSPVYAVDSGPNIVDYKQKATTAGFKGAQGLTWQGGEENVKIALPNGNFQKEKRKKRLRLQRVLKRLKAK